MLSTLFFGLCACEKMEQFEDGFNSDLSTQEIYETYPDVRPLLEGKHNEAARWTMHVLRQLEKTPQNFLATIPTDQDIFCPNYQNLNREQRKYFWAFIISLMVRFESNYNPAATYEESFDDSTGQPVVSRGLLQISFESSQSYGCGFTSAGQLHDAFRNLSCGINILKKWVPADQSIAGYLDENWRGGARYWSTLRSADKDSYNTIVKRSSELTLCQLAKPIP